jgi:hypothetical protein
MARRHDERRRIDRGLLIASFAIALGIAVVGFGVATSITGGEAYNLPDAIERVDPIPGSVQVLSKAPVFVDLDNGYTGILVVNGIEIETVNLNEIGSIEVEPGRQVDIPPATIFEPGNATLTFRPSDGAPVESFGSGVQQVQVIFWRIDDGPTRAGSYTWTFTTV